MITPVFAPYRAGMARVAQQYADSAHAAGHSVCVVTPAYPSRSQEKFEYDVVHVRPLLHFGNAAWIRSIEIDGDVDIIHVHVPFIGGIGAAVKLSKKYPRAKVIVTYHMDLISGGWKRPFFWLWNRLALPVVAKLADVIHVTSRDYFDHSIFSRYVRETPVVEIPLGIDVAQFSPREHVHGFSILLVASLDSSHMFKGVKRAVRAISRVSEAQLIIVGDGNMRASYEAIAHDLGCGDRVEFKGKVSDEVLSGLYARADITILPSTASSEAFGLVLIESQASGTPVIASDLPGVRTVFTDGASGFSISTFGDDDLVAVLSRWYGLSDENKTAMRESAIANSTRFDRHKIDCMLLDVYQSLLQTDV